MDQWYSLIEDVTFYTEFLPFTQDEGQALMLAQDFSKVPSNQNIKL